MNIKYIGIEPEILISNKAWSKMTQYVKLVDSEIGWLGTVEIDDNIFTITDVFLVKQEVNKVTCEIDPTALIELYEQRIGDGLRVDDIILWGHSHNNMGVSPSGQDNNQFEEFAENNKYFIRLIMNKRGEVNIALLDSEKEIIFENLDFEFAYEDSDVDILKEIEEKVTEKSYAKSSNIFSNSNYTQYRNILNRYQTSLYDDNEYDDDMEDVFNRLTDEELEKLREKDIDDLSIEEAQMLGILD